jgi:adenosylcobyric acid synthase
MLGRRVLDPDGVEGAVREADGLGLLDVETVMAPQKTVRNIAARSARFDTPIEGYEIHMGETDGGDRVRPVAIVDGNGEGATSPDGKVLGTYLHGLFTADAFRKKFLESLGIRSGDLDYRAAVENALDGVADGLEAHLDCNALLAAAR